MIILRYDCLVKYFNEPLEEMFLSSPAKIEYFVCFLFCFRNHANQLTVEGPILR